jgi:hypothetical protein
MKMEMPLVSRLSAPWQAALLLPALRKRREAALQLSARQAGGNAIPGSFFCAAKTFCSEDPSNRTKEGMMRILPQLHAC